MAASILELKNGITFGLVLSILVTALIAAGYWVNPEVWLSQYPPDIRNKVGLVSDKTREQSRVFTLLFVVFLLGTLVVSLLRLWQLRNGQMTFQSSFISTFTLLIVFNLFDILVLDWLVLVTIRPSRIILPGTEGMKGYGDYMFHLRGFLAGLILALFIGLVLAGISVLLARII